MPPQHQWMTGGMADIATVGRFGTIQNLELLKKITSCGATLREECGHGP